MYIVGQGHEPDYEVQSRERDYPLLNDSVIWKDMIKHRSYTRNNGIKPYWSLFEYEKISLSGQGISQETVDGFLKRARYTRKGLLSFLMSSHSWTTNDGRGDTIFCSTGNTNTGVHFDIKDLKPTLYDHFQPRYLILDACNMGEHIDQMRKNGWKSTIIATEDESYFDHCIMVHHLIKSIGKCAFEYSNENDLSNAKISLDFAKIAMLEDHNYRSCTEQLDNKKALCTEKLGEWQCYAPESKLYYVRTEISDANDELVVPQLVLA